MTTDEFGVVGFQFTIKELDLAGYVGDLVLTSESCADLQRMCRALAAAGIEQTAPQQPALIPASGASRAQDVPPLCPVHSRAMKPSKAPGQWFCSAQIEDGSGYCKEKVKR